MPNMQAYDVGLRGRPRCAAQAVNSLNWLTPAAWKSVNSEILLRGNRHLPSFAGFTPAFGRPFWMNDGRTGEGDVSSTFSGVTPEARSAVRGPAFSSRYARGWRWTPDSAFGASGVTLHFLPAEGESRATGTEQAAPGLLRCAGKKNRSFKSRHCKERSDEAIHQRAPCWLVDCFTLLRGVRNDD
jgi:hypothetical protein